MILSRKHNFVFIHIWKTAGSSLREALYPYGTPNLIGRVFAKIGLSQALIPNSFLRHYDVHATFADLEASLEPQVLDDMFSFAVVRNPWDWHVSLYHYMQQQKGHYQRDLALNLEDFGSYLHWRSSAEMIDQIHFLRGGNGRIGVKYVGRFEDLGGLQERFHVASGLDLSIGRVRQSSHSDYREYYTKDWMVECVREMNAEDITEFGYDFE